MDAPARYVGMSQEKWRFHTGRGDASDLEANRRRNQAAVQQEIDRRHRPHREDDPQES